MVAAVPVWTSVPVVLHHFLACRVDADDLGLREEDIAGRTVDGGVGEGGVVAFGTVDGPGAGLAGEGEFGCPDVGAGV